MKVKYKLIITSILFVLISFVCIAQNTPGTPPPPPSPSFRPPPPVGLPIDGGLTYGIAFALLYGLQKLRTKRTL